MMLSKAIEIAARLHAGQTTRDGLDYILHPLQVMHNLNKVVALLNAAGAKTHFVVDDMLRCIAVLHDVLEDTDITPKELQEELETVGDCMLSVMIVSALILLKHERGQSYEDYITQTANSSYSAIVKLADIMHNSDVTRGANPKKLPVYAAAYKNLFTKLVEGNYIV